MFTAMDRDNDGFVNEEVPSPNRTDSWTDRCNQEVETFFWWKGTTRVGGMEVLDYRTLWDELDTNKVPT